MRQIVIAVLAVALLHIPSASSADVEHDDITIGTLFDFCKSEELVATITCWAYIRGFVTGHTFAVAHTEEMVGQSLYFYAFCLPSDVGVRELQAAFTKHAEQNPDEWHLMASIGIAESLADPFPCNPE